jgi:hypothetical protein
MFLLQLRMSKCKVFHMIVDLPISCLYTSMANMLSAEQCDLFEMDLVP